MKTSQHVSMTLKIDTLRRLDEYRGYCPRSTMMEMMISSVLDELEQEKLSYQEKIGTEDV